MYKRFLKSLCREEIGQLKEELNQVRESSQTWKCELEVSKNQLSMQIEDLLLLLKEKNEELQELEKYKTLQESNAALSQSKVDLQRIYNMHNALLIH